MSDVFSRINADIDSLKIGAYTSGLMALLDSESMSPEQLESVAIVFDHLRKQKEETIRNTLLKMSRLPLKEPETFDNFDFNNVHGKQIEALKNLPALTAVNAGRNLAFIGPQGVGKTHLAMAYGRECCIRGMKTYFLKATELNQRIGRQIGDTVFKHEVLCINNVSVLNFDRIFFREIIKRFVRSIPG